MTDQLAPTRTSPGSPDEALDGDPKRHSASGSGSVVAGDGSVTDFDAGQNLRDLATTSVKWTALSHVLRLGSHFLVTSVLALFLVADDFGVLGLAMLVIGFASVFRDAGLPAAVVQRRQLGDADLATLFWTNLGIGFVLTAAIWVTAPWLARLLDAPGLAPVLQTLALTLLLGALGGIHAALLQRQMRFAALARCEVISLLSGAAAGIGAAALGLGIWSLVVQQLVMATLQTVLLISHSRFRPARRFQRRVLQDVGSFSGNLVGFHAFDWLIRSFDQLLIGAVLGTTALGYYVLAHRLVLVPMTAIAATVSRVLLPLFARIQDDHTRMRHAYRRVVAVVAFLVFPAMAVILITSQPLVLSLLGSKWQPAAPILALFAGLGALQCIGCTVGPIYHATERTDLMLRWGFAAGLVSILSVLVGLTWGVVGVAAAYTVTSLLLSWPGLAIPYRQIGLSVGEVLRVLLRPTAATLLTIAAGFGLRYLLVDLSPMPHLIVVLTGTAIVYLLASLWLNRGTTRELLDLALRLRPATPNSNITESSR